MNEASITCSSLELKVDITRMAHVKSRQVYSGIRNAERHNVVKYICQMFCIISVLISALLHIVLLHITLNNRDNAGILV